MDVGEPSFDLARKIISNASRAPYFLLMWFLDSLALYTLLYFVEFCCTLTLHLAKGIGYDF